MIQDFGCGEVYLTICKILADNGFEQMPNGDMNRRDTGCSFPVEYLINVDDVLSFQLEWGYSFSQ